MLVRYCERAGEGGLCEAACGGYASSEGGGSGWVGVGGGGGSNSGGEYEYEGPSSPECSSVPGFGSSAVCGAGSYCAYSSSVLTGSDVEVSRVPDDKPKQVVLLGRCTPVGSVLEALQPVFLLSGVTNIAHFFSRKIRRKLLIGV